jgi:ribonuclease HI
MRIERTFRPLPTAWTDGSCNKDGKGGWGVLIRYPDRRRTLELYGGEHETTISRMELKAAIMAVQLMVPGEESLLYSDSKYVVTGINEQLFMWLRNGWRTGDNRPLKNLDLWQEFHALHRSRTVEVRWVKGHSRDAGNDRADELASIGRKSLDQ